MTLRLFYIYRNQLTHYILLFERHTLCLPPQRLFHSVENLKRDNHTKRVKINSREGFPNGKYWFDWNRSIFYSDINRLLFVWVNCFFDVFCFSLLECNYDMINPLKDFIFILAIFKRLRQESVPSSPQYSPQAVKL